MDAGRNLCEPGLHPAPDQAQDGRQRDQIADVVGKLHRPPPVARLAGRVDHHREREIQVAGDPRFLREELLRHERPNLALDLNRDPLPGPKMPAISFRRRAGCQMEKTLEAIHGNILARAA